MDFAAAWGDDMERGGFPQGGVVIVRRDIESMDFVGRLAFGLRFEDLHDHGGLGGLERLHGRYMGALAERDAGLAERARLATERG